LHHVLTLDPVPADLGISASRLVLATSLDALAEEGCEHFCQHEPDGTVVTDDETGSHPAFRETRVSLVRSPAARFQDWDNRKRDENLFRLGGFPVFVQAPSYPRCSRCKKTMMHLLSLDSDLPLDSEGPNGCVDFDWGSGGVANIFWCDGCRVSAWTWGCT
jgi:hypothetical protein